jgi:transcriptional regulator with XRE-family HTH domain
MTARQQKVPAVFGRRVRAERERQGWTLRLLAARCRVNATTVLRAEQGHDVTLRIATALAAGLGLPLSILLAEPECAQCDGKPPAGFICSACGREGAA